MGVPNQVVLRASSIAQSNKYGEDKTLKPSHCLRVRLPEQSFWPHWVAIVCPL